MVAGRTPPRRPARIAVLWPVWVLAVIAAATPAGAAPARLGPHAATLPPGYQLVRDGPLSAPPSALDSGGLAQCPAGTVVWGGGVGSYANSTALTVNTSEPYGTEGWDARINNAGSTTLQFYVDAICAKKPKGYKITYKTVDNATNTQSHATAVCPSPKVVIAGGALSTSDEVDAFLTSIGPAGTTKFKVFVYNGTSTDAKVTAYAICAAKPRGYSITSTSFSVPQQMTWVSGFGCPGRHWVIGGGVQAVDHLPVVRVNQSADDGSYGWVIQATNSGQEPHQVDEYAICAA